MYFVCRLYVINVMFIIPQLIFFCNIKTSVNVEKHQLYQLY